jgi:spore maturation protein CgeB
VYKTMEEMQDKILYYLDHREERLRIARAGRDLALNHHRERHRYEDLILGDWSQRDEYGVSLLRP